MTSNLDFPQVYNRKKAPHKWVRTNHTVTDNKKRGVCPVMIYFASVSGITETVFLLPKPRLNFTIPAIFANSV